MYCRCNNEFEWLMNMLKEGNCFSTWEDVGKFIDDALLELRYMKKRFGYLFYDHYVYIRKINGSNAIFVNKEDDYVCRKPEEPHYHGIIEKENGEEEYINISIPMEDRERYDIKSGFL